MINRLKRICQRYLSFGPIVTVYHYARSRAMVAPNAQVQLTGQIVFGPGTVVKAYAVVKTMGGRIVFGRNCAISAFNHIGTGQSDIVVGNDVRLGPYVSLAGASRNFRKRDQRIVDQGHTHKGLVIGDDVLVGAGARIMDGLTIGDGAVIGAGAIVTKDVEPFQIVAGVPAKPLGYRE